MATIRELRARFSAQANGFRETVKGIVDDMEKVGDEGEESSDRASKGFEGLKTTLLGFAGAYLGFEAIKGAVGGVITLTDDYQSSLNTLQTQTGATDKEMKGMGESLKNIYANNYGQDFQDIATSMSLVERATGLTGGELEKATERALMLRDTFEYDVAESTRVADTMMKQFGISSEEAYTLIAQGAQGGLDKHGDMLDSFNEYSVYFEQLGFDAEGMWNVFQAGSESGAFNMDKVGDAVKEFGIRVKDGSKESRMALDDLGLDIDEMETAFGEGGESAQLAMQKVFEQLGAIEDPLARNAIGVSLFGTQFEDLEHETVLALGTVRNEANMSADTLDKIDQQKYTNIGSAIEGLKRQFIVNLLGPIETQVMPLMNQFVSYMTANMPAMAGALQTAFSGIMTAVTALAPTFKNIFEILYNVGATVIPIVVGAFGGIITALIPVANALTGIVAKFTAWSGFAPIVIGLTTAFLTFTAITKAGAIGMALVTNAVKLWTIAQKALNIVLKLNPIGIIISLLAGLVAGLIWAYQNSETFRDIVNGAWSSIKTVVSGVIAWFATTIPQWINSIIAWFKNMGNGISNTWNALKTGTIAIWTALKNAVVALVMAWINQVKSNFNVMKNAVVQIFNALRTGAVAVWNALKNAVVAVVNGFVNLVQTIFRNYINAYIKLFNLLKTGVLAVWNALKNAVMAVVNAWVNLVRSQITFMSNTVRSIFNALRSTAVSIWNSLRSGVVSVVNGLRSAVVSVVNAIRSGVSNGFNSAKTLAINAFNALRSGVTGAIEGVRSFVSSKMQQIKGYFDIDLFSQGADMIRGFINGIASMARKVVDSALDVVNGAVDAVMKKLGIASPSKLFTQFGEWTGEGLGNGIENMKGMVEDATQGLADVSIGTINDAELNPLDGDLPMGGGGQGGQGTNYNAPLMAIENYYQNDDTDIRALSNGLYNLQRNSDRKKGK